MQELLKKTVETFKSFNKKVCEKVKGLVFNLFNISGKLGVIKGLLGFPSDMKGSTGF